MALPFFVVVVSGSLTPEQGLAALLPTDTGITMPVDVFFQIFFILSILHFTRLPS